MGWSIGHCDKHDRDIGYGVPAFCDHPDCNAEIDRGVSYLCGDIHKDGGCGLHFCEKHRSNYMPRKGISVCDRCYKGRKPFAAKPDHHKWLRWKLRDDSWQKWRDENPAKCDEMLKHLRKLKREGVIDMIFGDKRDHRSGDAVH